MGINICIGRSSRGVEGEHTRGKKTGVIFSGNSGGTFYQNERGVQGV